MKLKYLYYLLVAPLIGVLLFSAFSVNDGHDKKGNKDRIKFSHQFHLEITDCESCHTSVSESTDLKEIEFPNHDNCVLCHDVEDMDNCNTCHYDENFEALEKEECNDLLFNHKFHLDEQDLECQACHQGFDEVDYSSELKDPNPVMADCYSCHNNQTIATNNCESCHISTADLKPQDHKSASFMMSHKFSARNFDANCVMCHDTNQNSCQACHVATNTITESNAPNDFFMPYSPAHSIDGTEQQKITRVHDLNFRFTHGIDAKGNTSECQTCHNVETFCVYCHQVEENGGYALSGIVPASHLKPNFFTIGVGSGGGEHAILAKRDLESCAACHDTQGADPTCIQCHLDSDGIEGTNPKTHERNFMSDVEGDWHSSVGSICYNCHTSASPMSNMTDGFCNYCHGN